MRKRPVKHLFTLFVTIGLLILLVTLASSCSEIRGVAGIRVNGPEETPSFPVGEFDYDSYSVTVLYTDGTSRDIPLTSEMISALERIKFYNEGKQTVTVSYSNMTSSFDVIFTRNTFDEEEISLSSLVAVYDGKAHTVEVTGNIPAGTSISYPSGNSFTNVGVYSVTAVLTRENYVSATLSSNVVISPGTYDVSDFQFDSADFYYDGEEKEIEATGTLPEGVRVSYKLYNAENDSPLQQLSVTEVGHYYYLAKFSFENANYQAIPDKKVTMNILPATYDMSKVSFQGEEVQFDGKAHSIEIKGTLPKGVSVTYSRGEVTDAGTYPYIAFFTGDDKNYNPIPSLSAVLTITPTEPQVGKFNLDPVEDYVYDGEEHFPKVSTLVDLDKERIQIDYLIRKGNNVRSGETVEKSIDAGTYTVEARFTYRDGDPNYTQLPSLFLTYSIAKKTLSLDSLTFPSSSFIYNGSEQYPIFDEEALAALHLSATYKVRSGNAQSGVETIPVNAGSYTVEAVFSVLNNDSNYVACPSTYFSFTIEPAEIVINPVFSSETEFVYTPGVSYTVKLQNEAELLEQGITTVYTIRKGNNVTVGEAESQTADAGYYTVEASFINAGGAENYKSLPSVYQTYRILPKQVSLEAKYLFAEEIGKITYSGVHVSPSFTISEVGTDKLCSEFGIATECFYRSGADVTTGAYMISTVDSGTYTMQVKLVFLNPNYCSETDSFYETYDIVPVVIDLPYGINYSLVYDGNSHIPKIGIDFANNIPWLGVLSNDFTAVFVNPANIYGNLPSVQNAATYSATYTYTGNNPNFVFANDRISVEGYVTVQPCRMYLSDVKIPWTEALMERYITPDGSTAERKEFPLPSNWTQLQKLFPDSSVYAYEGHNMTSGTRIEGGFSACGLYTLCLELGDTNHNISPYDASDYATSTWVNTTYYKLYFNLTLKLYELDLTEVRLDWYVKGSNDASLSTPTLINLPSDFSEFFTLVPHVKSGINAFLSASDCSLSGAGQYTVWFEFNPKSVGAVVHETVGLVQSGGKFFYRYNFAVVDETKYGEAWESGRIYDTSAISISPSTIEGFDDSTTAVYSLTPTWNGSSVGIPQCFIVKMYYSYYDGVDASWHFMSEIGVPGNWGPDTFQVEMTITSVDPSVNIGTVRYVTTLTLAD